MKSGFKTTEFALTLITVIAAATASAKDLVDPKTGLILGTVSTIAYALSRAFVKGSAERPKRIQPQIKKAMDKV